MHIPATAKRLTDNSTNLHTQFTIYSSVNKLMQRFAYGVPLTAWHLANVPVVVRCKFHSDAKPYKRQAKSFELSVRRPHGHEEVVARVAWNLG